LIVHIGFTHQHELFRPLVQQVEIIGCIGDLDPFDAEPAGVLHDGVYEFGLFLGRVGIVEAQDQLAFVLLGNQVIDHESLHMTDVQITVRLRWQPCADVIEAACAQVFCDGLAYKISGFAGGILFCSHVSALL
jgi:hypothetical protein